LKIFQRFKEIRITGFRGFDFYGGQFFRLAHAETILHFDDYQANNRVTVYSHD
jgi:hypothetical protein